MQNCPYITIRKKWKLFEFVSGFFWKKINKNRKNTPNRALQIVNLIILFIYQKFSNMHQTMQNCLPINVQRVNRWKIEVVNSFFIDLGPPAQFVRHCRMTVKRTSFSNCQKANFCSKSWYCKTVSRPSIRHAQPLAQNGEASMQTSSKEQTECYFQNRLYEFVTMSASQMRHNKLSKGFGAPCGRIRS